jgi:hypothetical protein
MKNNNRGTSIIEVIVSMVILVMWIIWTYQIYFRTMHLSESSKNRLTAIEIAREWIEAVTNIRDTNWLNYWADYKNCWNVLNYNTACVNDNSTTYDILDWSYYIFKDSDNKWKLLSWWWTSWVFSDINYRNKFQIHINWNWFYMQYWWVTTTDKKISPLFTREIKISYPEDTDLVWWINSNDEKMQVVSLVQWIDSSTTKVQKVELTTILSNRKNRKN